MNKEQLDAILAAMLDGNEATVSDLVFVTGKPPQVEREGRLEPLAMEGPDAVLQPLHIQTMSEILIQDSQRLRTEFEENGSCDLSYALGDRARFRVNIYKQNGERGIVMRRLQSRVPLLSELGLPPIFSEMVKEKNGIIFVTGGTGTGKTTTLAAMLNELNQTQKIHIVTLEDPIEFLHTQKQATFSQRELGKDFPNFAVGLRAALRQAPKVILVGEIRDRVTMEIALTAAETGHVVYATLHTISASQSINRIIGMFEQGEQSQVRERLASTLRYIVSQRLSPKIGGGRQLLTEIMGNNLRTRETVAIGEGEHRNFYEIIEASAPFGWMTFDQSILNAYENDLISEDHA